MYIIIRFKKRTKTRSVENAVGEKTKTHLKRPKSVSRLRSPYINERMIVAKNL